MDERLVAWARAVKARQRLRTPLPVLWLFTDAARLPDPRGAVARLPAGLCGVVLRHDADPARAILARDLARLCRARRNQLVVAGDGALARAVGAGQHLRGGRRLLMTIRFGALVTSSAHGVADLRRAARAGATLAFLSPAFATASHPEAVALGPVRWSSRARQGPAGLGIAALGGIDGGTVRRLPAARGAGAIGALV